MKRFNLNEDGDDFQEGEYSDEESELNEYIALLEKNELIEVLKTQLYQKKMNQELLMRVVKFLSKSFFWRFKTQKKKLQLIIETYQTFKVLVDIDNQEEEE
jgi:hypothetical protein